MMTNKSKTIELINDWIKMNPTFKKKFSITDFYIVDNKNAHITTETTTKTNQTTLQKLLPSFLKYLSIEVDKVYITNFFKDTDFKYHDYIQNYLFKVGLEESEFTINVNKISQHFTEIIVLVDVDIFRLLNLDIPNLYLDQEELFSFNLIDKKYKGQFSYHIEFTDKLNDSIVELNKTMIKYLARRNWELVQEMNPKIGIFKGGKTIEVFINNNGKEHYLDRVLDNFFKHYRLNKNYHWRTYRRGPWLDGKEVVYGTKD